MPTIPATILDHTKRLTQLGVDVAFIVDFARRGDWQGVLLAVQSIFENRIYHWRNWRAIKRELDCITLRAHSFLSKSEKEEDS